MPNWCEGSLKVRGKIDNVRKFIEEELKAYTGTEWVKAFDTESENLDIGCYYYDIGSYYYKVTDKASDLSMINVWSATRAFLNLQTDHLYLMVNDDGTAFFAASARQAWGFCEHEWIEIAKKYGIDIRLYGTDGLMPYGQEFEVVAGEYHDLSPDTTFPAVLWNIYIFNYK